MRVWNVVCQCERRVSSGGLLPGVRRSGERVAVEKAGMDSRVV